MMAFLKTGPGIKTAEPSKPFFYRSDRSLGCFRRLELIRVLKVLELTGQQLECPRERSLKLGRQLLLVLPDQSCTRPCCRGETLCRQIFLGEWRSMMFLFASAIKITVSISSTKSRIFASIETSEPKTSLKAWRLLLLPPTRKKSHIYFNH